MTMEQVDAYLRLLSDEEKTTRELADQGLRQIYNASATARRALHDRIPSLRGERLVAVLNLVNHQIRNDRATASRIVEIAIHPEDHGTGTEIARIGQAACQALYGTADFLEVRRGLIRVARGNQEPAIRATALSSLAPSYDLPEVQECVLALSADPESAVKNAAAQAMNNASALERMADDGSSLRLSVLSPDQRDLADQLHSDLKRAIETLKDLSLNEDQERILDRIITPNIAALHALARDRGATLEETRNKRESGGVKAALVVGGIQSIVIIGANADRFGENAKRSVEIAQTLGNLFLKAVS